MWRAIGAAPRAIHPVSASLSPANDMVELRQHYPLQVIGSRRAFDENELARNSCFRQKFAGLIRCLKRMEPIAYFTLP